MALKPILRQRSAHVFMVILRKTITRWTVTMKEELYDEKINSGEAFLAQLQLV